MYKENPEKNINFSRKNIFEFDFSWDYYNLRRIHGTFVFGLRGF